ncbi:MAG: alkaline-phosphatase-like protein [Monoraphidium minutum]|nr:MAG: alkaline-phosphatase-like protein [Monoraphidium minutum]
MRIKAFIVLAMCLAVGLAAAGSLQDAPALDAAPSAPADLSAPNSRNAAPPRGAGAAAPLTAPSGGADGDAAVDPLSSIAVDTTGVVLPVAAPPQARGPPADAAPEPPAADPAPEPRAEPAPAEPAPAPAEEANAAKPADAPWPHNDGPAKGCIPPTLVDPVPSGVPVPPLPEGERPNFIVILTDDQGWDDIGRHNRKYVRTPNLDRFLERSTQFDNFYVAPMCSQSRSSLLTGRDYTRTGTMLVNGGYDYINRGEATIGNVMAAGGYATAHFGKWHNGRTLGYEPWQFGFEDSWFPELYINLDNLMRHNGKYVQTEGLMEQALMDTMIGWLGNRTADPRPFAMYYAPNAIHQGFMRPGQGPKWQRPAPKPYVDRFRHFQDEGVSPSTIEVWAMLEYMDDVLGRLFDYLETSPLHKNTYVLLMGDNGSELFDGEKRNIANRMPSGMQGSKRAIEEGGIRNFLGVQGPGVKAGVIDSTLTEITDILPTIADLGRVPPGSAGHLPFSGTSIKNLLLPQSDAPEPRRGTALATKDQKDRFAVSFSPMCWDSDTVPALGPDRRVVKPQPLLDFDGGGILNEQYQHYYKDGSLQEKPGYERCLAVRYKDFKWIGRTGKVYRFKGDSHIELPCNEVTGPEGDALRAVMSVAGRQWWESVLAEPHSFQKPTFFLGFEGWSVTNVLPDGAHERTPGRIRLQYNGASGFQMPGDRMCFAAQVMAGGTYDVSLFYTSAFPATFTFAIGPIETMSNGEVPSITATLPALSAMRGQRIGHVKLAAAPTARQDICLILVATPNPGESVFSLLGDIRVSLVAPDGGFTPKSAANAVPATASDVPRTRGSQRSAEDEVKGGLVTAAMERAHGHAAARKAERRAAHGGVHAAAAGEGGKHKAGAASKDGAKAAVKAKAASVASKEGGATATLKAQPAGITSKAEGAKATVKAQAAEGTKATVKAQAAGVGSKAEVVKSKDGGKPGKAEVKGALDGVKAAAAAAVAKADPAAAELVSKGGKAAAGKEGKEAARRYVKQLRHPGYAEPAGGVDASELPKAAARRATAVARRNMKATRRMKAVEADALLAAAARTRKERAAAPPAGEAGEGPEWYRLRTSHNWPEGQGPLLESLYSPYAAEAIGSCHECQPVI